MLGLFVDLKVESYENKKSGKEDVLKNFAKCKKHLNLLMKFSPLLAYYVVFFSNIYEFINLNAEDNGYENLLELFNVFQEFLIFRKFNKQ